MTEKSVTTQKRSGRPVEVLTLVLKNNIEIVFLADRRVTVEEISLKLDESVGTVYEITHDDLNFE